MRRLSPPGKAAEKTHATYTVNAKDIEKLHIIVTDYVPTSSYTAIGHFESDLAGYHELFIRPGDEVIMNCRDAEVHVHFKSAKRGIESKITFNADRRVWLCMHPEYRNPLKVEGKVDEIEIYTDSGALAGHIDIAGLASRQEIRYDLVNQLHNH